MSGGTINLAVIIGSVRKGRFGPTVANWFFDQAQRHGSVLPELVELADYPLPLTMPASDNLDETTEGCGSGCRPKSLPLMPTRSLPLRTATPLPRAE
ncbi:NADPH-dependent FMN reductase [Actinopolyspora sp. H202]|uniref:NADPH-dependent FMN reductase n=1 Tax=Actinopolyspora sp. H202 TaxID=1500456 RepID=UPI003EE7D57E